jgi:hypothetical protein
MVGTANHIGGNSAGLLWLSCMRIVTPERLHLCTTKLGAGLTRKDTLISSTCKICGALHKILLRLKHKMPEKAQDFKLLLFRFNPLQNHIQVRPEHAVLDVESRKYRAKSLNFLEIAGFRHFWVRAEAVFER